MVNKYIKKTFNIIRYYTAKIKKIPSVDKDVEQLEPSYTAGERVSWYNHFEKCISVSYQIKYTSTV